MANRKLLTQQEALDILTRYHNYNASALKKNMEEYRQKLIREKKRRGQ